MTNYFDFFNLPVSPRIDQKALKRQFYANSKRFHPDFHTLAEEDAREEALEQSTINNQGYKILADDDRRLKHLLDLKGVLGEEGSNKMPQAFLMEMMDINEALMELQFEDDPTARAKVDEMIASLEADFDSEVAEVLNHYDDATVSTTELEKLKDYYLKKRYLRRLKQQSPEV
ncbi:iron-sulfur cluster co-chaperone HscB C-terminal domain-containing protein [Neolewinella aurantiaca]|nr:iron-sulfur cluster co-chaperone HscB C-terminal domain-containing protein [Neolewinella aurantiaca]